MRRRDIARAIGEFVDKHDLQILAVGVIIIILLAIKGCWSLI